LPPASLQARTEHRVEQLNTEIYGAAWAWLPVPLWLSLVDPDGDGSELQRLEREWSARPHGKSKSNSTEQAHRMTQQPGQRRRAVLPVLRLRA
jgi:hypothetical protein